MKLMTLGWIAFVCCSIYAEVPQSALDELVRDIPLGETLSITLTPTRPTMDTPAVAAMAEMVVDGRVSSITAEPTGTPFHVSKNHGQRGVG